MLVTLRVCETRVHSERSGSRWQDVLTLGNESGAQTEIRVLSYLIASRGGLCAYFAACVRIAERTV